MERITLAIALAVAVYLAYFVVEVGKQLHIWPF